MATKKVLKHREPKKKKTKGAVPIGITPEGEPLKEVKTKIFTSDDEWFENWPKSDSLEWQMLKAEEAYADAYKSYLVARRILAIRRKQLHDKYVENKLEIATYKDHG